jgi:hypothetical protein
MWKKTPLNVSGAENGHPAGEISLLGEKIFGDKCVTYKTETTVSECKHYFT